MELYPIHLQLAGRKALVVGGGQVASVKAAALLDGGATVEIVAPSLSEEMKLLVEAHKLQSNSREFQTRDLEGAWLVVGATDDPRVQQTIFEEARRKNIMVCIVDDPARSDFIVPAVLRRGDLIVTVSTSGIAPALASRIRDYLGEILGEPFGKTVEDLKEVRKRLKRTFPELPERREEWFKLLDNIVLPALRRGEMPNLVRDYPPDKEEA